MCRVPVFGFLASEKGGDRTSITLPGSDILGADANGVLADRAVHLQAYGSHLPWMGMR